MLTRSWGKALLIAALLLVALVASAGQLVEAIDAVIRVPVEST
jgi:hypothetical protein